VTPSSRESSFPLLGASATFALAWLVLAWPWLSGRVVIPWDQASQFLPQVRFLAASLARGEWPWWTPNVFAGWPQIADPQSFVFAPLHGLLASLGPDPSARATDSLTFVHLLLGGLGLILIFRDRGWHPAGAVVAAIAFAFGGSAAARLQHTGQIISLAYLPLALWLLARALERGSWHAGAVAGVFGGLIAIGRDQVALLSLYLLAGSVIWHWLDGSERAERVRRSLGPLAAGAAAGCAVAVVPVVLSALLAADSNRPEFGFASAARGSLHPAHLMTFAFPDLFGASDPVVEHWGPPSMPWSEVWGWPGLYLAQNMGQVYSGALVALAIIGFGLIRGALWAREIRFFTIAALVVLLYALGWYTPVFWVLYEVLPGLTLFRRAADATFLFGALAAILAGYLVHRWLSGTMRTPRPWQRALEAATVAALVTAAVVIARGTGKLDVALLPIATSLGFAASAVATLAVARWCDASAAMTLLAAFMVLDLGWNNAPTESTGLNPAVYDALKPGTQNETVRLLKQRVVAGEQRRDRVELIGIGYHWPNLGLAHGLEHVFGHNPLRLKWFFEATGVGDTVAGPGQRRFAPLYPSYRSPMADLFGLRFIATGVPVEQIDSSLKPGDLDFVARTIDAYVYENPRALPRVMLLTDWRLVDFDALLQQGWPDADPRRTVLLERAPGVSPLRDAGPASARIIRYRNTELVVAIDAPAGGILVLNDVWHPWWRVRVDGQPAELLRANVIFRGVVVPPGKQLVRFTFHPFAGAWRELWAKLRGERVPGE
jgi:hypothetical protein